MMQRIININQPNQAYSIQTLLEDFYSQFKRVVQAIQAVEEADDTVVFMNEDMLHSVLNYIALQTQHATFGSEIYTRKLNSKERGE